MDTRQQQLKAWLLKLAAKHSLDPEQLEIASADASFRRYFRVVCQDQRKSLIVMDAPPAHEDVRPFVAVARLFADAGMTTPAIVEEAPELGFLLLEDFGDHTYLQVLDQHRPESERVALASALYREAGSALCSIQLATRANQLPLFDASRLRDEMELWPRWYIERHKGKTLSQAQRLIIDQAFDCIVARCLAQAQVYVHRDFHSRSLMLLAGARNPGVLDFQDAVIGPITYDLVSLWRDAYIAWDEEVQLDGLIRWWDQARKRGLPVDDAFSDFWTAFEWVGLQRHLKILGIFARLHYRDGKERYLADLPVVLSYTLPVLMRYQELAALADLVIEWLES
ncbi:MAG: aminoglycoside phosphotransferase [Betaproteobacteria bacterium]|nr:aminoglycoside phosphotransferase [Betaproteobacteria bacterium]